MLQVNGANQMKTAHPELLITFLRALLEVPLLHINVQRFRGGLVFKAHRLLYHSTLGLRVIKRDEDSPPRAAHHVPPRAARGTSSN